MNFYHKKMFFSEDPEVEGGEDEDDAHAGPKDLVPENYHAF